MKKTLTCCILVCTMVIGAAIAIEKQNKPTLTPLQTANIEALTDGESGITKEYKCYTSLVYEYGSAVVECTTCELKYNYTDRWYNFADVCRK